MKKSTCFEVYQSFASIPFDCASSLYTDAHSLTQTHRQTDTQTQKHTHTHTHTHTFGYSDLTLSV